MTEEIEDGKEEEEEEEPDTPVVGTFACLNGIMIFNQIIAQAIQSSKNVSFWLLDCNFDCFVILLVQTAPGHKRVPSDASVASSEDDKVLPTPSTLESVSEKMETEPADDRTSDKLSDEGLGTSEVDKTEEEKLNEVSDVSNEDLASGLMETSKDFISQDSNQSKPEGDQTEKIPDEPVVTEPEKPVETVNSEELVADGQSTEDEQETVETKMEDEAAQVLEEDKEPEHLKQEQNEEAAVDESIESEEKPEDTPTETISKEVSQTEESDEMSQHKVTESRTEDMIDARVENIDTVKRDSVVIDSNINEEIDKKLHLNESSTEVLLENKTIDSQPEENSKGEVPEESEQPEALSREELEPQEKAPNESVGVSDEVQDKSEASEPMVASKETPVKEDDEKEIQADENTSQDAISVQESETDSELKMEHGSPSVIKSDVEKDSDSGSSSAADSNSLDLNLSISSFLSKSKEGGSVSMQVMHFTPHLLKLHSVIDNFSL